LETRLLQPFLGPPARATTIQRIKVLKRRMFFNRTNVKSDRSPGKYLAT
jgi:hypothetical protein